MALIIAFSFLINAISLTSTMSHFHTVLPILHKSDIKIFLHHHSISLQHRSASIILHILQTKPPPILTSPFSIYCILSSRGPLPVFCTQHKI